MEREPDDYGNHLNKFGEPMCRLCRLYCSGNPYTITSRARVFERGTMPNCQYCRRIKVILKEIEALRNPPKILSGIERRLEEEFA